MTKCISTAIFLLGGIVAFLCQGMTTWAETSNPGSEPIQIAQESVVDLNSWNFTATRREVARHQVAENRQLSRFERCVRAKLRSHQQQERKSRSITAFDFQQASDDCIAAIVALRRRR
jgi:hypothetical protein